MDARAVLRDLSPSLCPFFAKKEGGKQRATDGGVAEETGKQAYFVKNKDGLNNGREMGTVRPGLVEMKSRRHTGSEGRSGGLVGLN